jgi:hypothetical protein
LVCKPIIGLSQIKALEEKIQKQSRKAARFFTGCSVDLMKAILQIRKPPVKPEPSRRCCLKFTLFFSNVLDQSLTKELKF